MSIMNVKHAEKLIRRRLRDANGAIGTTDHPFFDVLFHGRRPAHGEVAYCRDALANLEERKTVYVVRGPVGEPVSVDMYDCAKAIVESVRPHLENYELLPVMHQLLIEMSDAKGYVHSGRSLDEFVLFLTGGLEVDYEITSEQVRNTYSAMMAIGLRGSHQSRSGTYVHPVVICLRDGRRESPSDGRLTHELDQAVAKVEELEAEVDRLRKLTGTLYTQAQGVDRETTRINAELGSVLEENASLTEQNARLTQSNDDLRRGKQELQAVFAELSAVLAKVNKNA